MNDPSARSSFASGPLVTTKRAPEIFAAASKSIIPNASPISKCCFGAKSNVGGVPTFLISLLSRSSLPSGTSSRAKFGITASAASSAACLTRSSFSSSAIASFSVATSPIRISANAPSFAPLALPISFDTALRFASASCSLVLTARRASSCLISPPDNGSNPRRIKAASKAPALSLIHLMSNTGRPLQTDGKLRPPS